MKREKVLSCVFFDDVPCSFRRSEKFKIIGECSQCPRYKRFLREMDEEEEEDARLVSEIYGESKAHDSER